VPDTLRSELICVLMEQHSQGRFARASAATGQARSVLLHNLTHSIADVLFAGCAEPGSTYAVVLADAEGIAAAVLSGRSSTIHSAH
jgi:uncharacterized lipoprotein YajG